MKLNTRTAFEQLVKEAAEAELQLRDLERPARKKLSAKAFVAEAIANARSSPEKVAALRQTIEGNATAFPYILRFLRKSVHAIRESHMPAPPPSASHSYLSVLGRDECGAELATLGSHVMELFCLAVQDAERFPDVFGTATSSEGWKRDHAATKKRRDELFARIGKEFTRDDEAHDDVRPDGFARVTFRISGGAVTTTPFANAGERLVNWIVVQPDVLRTLGVQIPV